MYRIFLLAALCLAASVVSAQTTIRINKKEININGVVMQRQSKIDEFIKVLGEPGRVLGSEARLANTIYVYDELGLYIYESHETKDIIEISIDFKRDRTYDFSPKKKFAGLLYLNDAQVSRKTSYRQFEKINGVSRAWVMFGDAQGNFGDFLILLDYGRFQKRWLKHASIYLDKE
jgi:hypothetical protein